jgi:hypothetical protein
VGSFGQTPTNFKPPHRLLLGGNTTRILTATNGQSVVRRLITSPKLKDMMVGKQLEQAISTYSVKIADGARVPVEVTDGLRVLGAPIGSSEFAFQFMSKILDQAISDSNKLLSNLEDIQTMTRLFSSCTVHKITHLFSSDVFHAPMQSMPSLFYLWESRLCDQFNSMIDNFLSKLTNLDSLPPHAHIIASMSINQGGLGLRNPRGNAITTYMTSSKRCLQYAFEGVWLGRDKPRPILPESITSLYTPWETDACRSWTIFRKFLPTFSTMACADATSPSDYIFKASLNGSSEKAKEVSSKMMKKNVLFNEHVTPLHIRQALPSVLDKRHVVPSGFMLLHFLAE